MSDQPAAKRQRTDETSSPEEVVRSEIWYDDGSVILQAESTQCRVHWTVLAQHSSIFNDMRGIPQPPDEPRVEGCPIVRLSDSIQDVEHLLRAVYDPLFDSADELEFPVVAAIVRLGKKYDFSRLLAAVVARLTAHFPRTLHTYNSGPATERIVLDPGLCFDAINLATENGLFALLPALYFSALLDVEPDASDEILIGVERADKTTANLSFENQVILLRSQKQAHLTQAQLLFEWMTPENLPSSVCTSSATCAAQRDNLTHDLFVPLYTLRASLSWNILFEREFCPECGRAMKFSFKRGARKFWDELPRLFGLPDWAELKNEI
ncbi:hypothetical protein FB451DRAFT_1263058 [Mycena latifolia]|nr:hypothetical protein FB451DRAFT_1263058 [Mycena latifolia]